MANMTQDEIKKRIAALSPAERKRFLAFVAVEKQKQLKRIELKRELDFIEKSYKRAGTEWEIMCRNIKMKELRDEIGVWWQEVNRICDRKTHLLKVYFNFLDEAEEQHQRTFSKHSELLNNIDELYKTLLQSLKMNYEIEVENRLINFQLEMLEKEEIQGDRRKFYENVLFLSNFITKENLERMREKFEYVQSEIINTNILQQYILRDLTVINMEKLYENAKGYVESIQNAIIDPRREERITKFLRDQEATDKAMGEQNKILLRHELEVGKLQHKLYRVEQTTLSRLNEIRNEKKFLLEHYWRLKANHSKITKETEQQLSFLGTVAYKALKELKKLEEYGKLLLSCASCCQKYQTEQEKVIPWPDAERVKKLMDEIEDVSADMENYHKMVLFWDRMSRAKSHVLALRDDKRKLLEERNYYHSVFNSVCKLFSEEKVASIRIKYFDASVKCTPCSELAVVTDEPEEEKTDED